MKLRASALCAIIFTTMCVAWVVYLMSLERREAKAEMVRLAEDRVRFYSNSVVPVGLGIVLSDNTIKSNIISNNKVIAVNPAFFHWVYSGAAGECWFVTNKYGVWLRTSNTMERVEF